MSLISKQNSALFLDFDGTLVDFAPTPEAVLVSDELRSLLKNLLQAFDGALALISGRAIESLDRLIELPELPVSGSHGAEWRLPGGQRKAIKLETEEFSAAFSKVERFGRERGLIVEDKRHSVALHFRQQPTLQPQVDEFLEREILAYKKLRVIYGNCVREIQPKGVDKGEAIAHFMVDAPYAGRTPVYIGDDTTDEDAFGWVNQRGGLSIKVGDGATRAKQRLSNIAEVLKYLDSLLRS